MENVHEMKLQPGPFRAIAAGRKTVEMRLFDEKRRALRVGDRIRFTEMGMGDGVMTVRITALRPYSDFGTLYADYPPAVLGYEEGEIPRPEDMEIYYSREEQARFGVLAIEIEREDEA